MIAPEGKIIIFPSAVITIVFYIGWIFTGYTFLMFIAMFGGLFIIFCFYFFRDPQRKLPLEDHIVLSPADGKIICIENIESSQSDSMSSTKLSIFLSIFDVHVNRVPVSGEVTSVNYTPGKFFTAFKQKASHLNERTEIHIKSGETFVKVNQIAGFIARRILCNLRVGDRVTRGDRLGFIRFGSRIDIFLPDTVNLTVKVGQKVKGGETILGEFV